MWLMASEVPVRLEILDQSGQRLFGAGARLMHLDEAHAVVVLEEPMSAARLHWGASVRFEVEDGLRRYEITGAIVARQEASGESVNIPISDEGVTSPTWEVRVKIWECKLNVQRRTLPRRKLRFRVHLQELPHNSAPDGPIDDGPETIPAWCVDIGAGGICVRTAKLDRVPARMRIEFCLPVSDGTHGVEETHKFCLNGRVIRSVPHGRHGDSMEVAFCFEGLSVRDGMALHNLLA